MNKKIIYLLLIILILIQCKTNILNKNEIALGLIKLENNGIITQSDKKDDFFDSYTKFSRNLRTMVMVTE